MSESTPVTQFTYRAVDRKGETLFGTLDARNIDEVAASLHRQGHIPVRIEPRHRTFLPEAVGERRPSLFRRDLSQSELTAITREMAVMLGAGQDIDRALRFLIETTSSSRLRRVLGAVRETVRSGRTLHLAMGQFPRSFPRLYLGMVRAAEATGDLAPTMDRLALLLERERALASTVQSAMIYPVILVIAATGSVTLLLTKVLPQFTPLFAQNGVALPASTRFLTGIGAWVGTYGGFLLLAIFVTFIGARVALRRPGLRLLRDRLILQCPGLGRLIAEIMAARFARILGTLLVNGVPLLAALAIVRDALENRAATEAITEAMENAKSGAGLSATLERANIFPERLVHLFQLGEETASLGPMALRAADIHEDQARIALQRLVAILVPGITIIMGLLVAGIVSSLLLAMLSLNDLAR